MPCPLTILHYGDAKKKSSKSSKKLTKEIIRRTYAKTSNEVKMTYLEQVTIHLPFGEREKVTRNPNECATARTIEIDPLPWWLT